jgi:regulator of RNase E activity RraA
MTTPEDGQDKPAWRLPVRGDAFERAPGHLVEGMRHVTAATSSALMHKMGITHAWVNGPAPLSRGQSPVAGSALTLQFMPQREDIASGMEQETIERNTALWAVLESVRPGDILVVQAYGSTYSGCLGDMLVRYFKKRGGAGIVVDGRIRDSRRVQQLGVPVWCTGVTPNYASQAELFPWAYDVPVAVGGVLCLPGDIVVADDDGAVVVPIAKAAELVRTANEHEVLEGFSRMRLDEGARLSEYYPVSEQSRAEYEQWSASGKQ